MYRDTAQIYRDGDDAHWRDAPFAFEVEEREVKAGERMTLRLAAGGGAAVRFRAE
jgi:alpha-glucosidase